MSAERIACAISTAFRPARRRAGHDVDQRFALEAAAFEQIAPEPVAAVAGNRSR